MSAGGRVIDHVIWPDDDMTMRELVELFARDSKIAQQGGVLCMVTDGYLGCDVMFQVSGEEIFWVFDIHRQKRLVVMDSKKKFLSIPVTYPLKMNVVDTAGRIQRYNGKKAVTINEICEGLKFGDTLSTVMFEDDRQVSFNVGVNQGDSARLGRLDIVDTYEEKYLLANRILDCDIVVGSLAVPVYMPIMVTIANKFTYSSDLEAFQSWIEAIGQMSASFPRQEVVTCQEIIMIDEKPEGGHYEYIKPSNALRVSEKASATGSSRTGGAASATSDGDSEDSRRSGRYSGYVERRPLPPLPRQPRPLTRTQSERTPALPPPRPDHLHDRRPSEGASDFPAVPPPRLPTRTCRNSVDSSRLSLMLPSRRRPPPAVPVGDACGDEAADWSIPPVPSRSTARAQQPEPEPCRSEAATFPRRKQPASDDSSPRTVATYQLTTLDDDKEWKVTSPLGGGKTKKRNRMRHIDDSGGSRGDTEWTGSTSDHLTHKQYVTLAVGNVDKDVTVYGEHPYVVIRRQPTDVWTSGGSYPVEYLDVSPKEEEAPGGNENGDVEEVEDGDEEVEERLIDQEWKQMDADELPADGKAEIFDMRNHDDVFESSGVVKLVGRVDLTS